MKKIVLITVLFALYCNFSMANRIIKGTYWSDDVLNIWGCSGTTSNCVAVITPSHLTTDPLNTNNYYIQPDEGYNMLDVYLYNLGNQQQYTEVSYFYLYVAPNENDGCEIQGF